MKNVIEDNAKTPFPWAKELIFALTFNVEKMIQALGNLINCNEWLFFNMTLNLNTNPCIVRVPMQKKAHMIKSKFKAMTIFFIYIQGIVRADWVPESHDINKLNKIYYKEVLTAVCKYGWEEGDLKCGLTAHNSSPRHSTSTQHTIS